MPGLLPDGTATGLATEELRNLASVYYEPLWVVYRHALARGDLIDDSQKLSGKRIALGPGTSTQNGWPASSSH